VISKHSYFLHQQHDPQPFFSAAKHYKASDLPDRIKKALEKVLKQYGKASYAEKVDMVTNVILQNSMYVFNILFNTLSVNNFMQNLHSLDKENDLYEVITSGSLKVESQRKEMCTE